MCLFQFSPNYFRCLKVDLGKMHGLCNVSDTVIRLLGSRITFSNKSRNCATNLGFSSPAPELQTGRYHTLGLHKIVIPHNSLHHLLCDRIFFHNTKSEILVEVLLPKMCLLEHLIGEIPLELNVQPQQCATPRWIRGTMPSLRKSPKDSTSLTTCQEHGHKASPKLFQVLSKID